MAGGWSAHHEFPTPDLRVRTDFVTGLPRLAPDDLASMWRELAEATVPFLDALRLIECTVAVVGRGIGPSVANTPWL